jgi:hypothetical protein
VWSGSVAHLLMSSKRSRGWKALHCWQYRPLLPSDISTCMQMKSEFQLSAVYHLAIIVQLDLQWRRRIHRHIDGYTAAVISTSTHAIFRTNGADCRQPGSQACEARTSRALDCIRHTLYRLKYSLSRDKSFPQPDTCEEHAHTLHTSNITQCTCVLQVQSHSQIRFEGRLHFKHNHSVFTVCGAECRSLPGWHLAHGC